MVLNQLVWVCHVELPNRMGIHRSPKCEAQIRTWFLRRAIVQGTCQTKFLFFRKGWNFFHNYRGFRTSGGLIQAGVVAESSESRRLHRLKKSEAKSSFGREGLSMSEPKLTVGSIVVFGVMSACGFGLVGLSEKLGAEFPMRSKIRFCADCLAYGGLFVNICLIIMAIVESVENLYKWLSDHLWSFLYKIRGVLAFVFVAALAERAIHQKIHQLISPHHRVDSLLVEGRCEEALKATEDLAKMFDEQYSSGLIELQKWQILTKTTAVYRDQAKACSESQRGSWASLERGDRLLRDGLCEEALENFELAALMNLPGIERHEWKSLLDFRKYQARACLGSQRPKIGKSSCEDDFPQLRNPKLIEDFATLSSAEGWRRAKHLPEWRKFFGLGKKFTMQAVTQSKHRLLLKYHPDKHADSEDADCAHRLSMWITAGFELLKNHVKHELWAI